MQSKRTTTHGQPPLYGFYRQSGTNALSNVDLWGINHYPGVFFTISLASGPQFMMGHYTLASTALMSTIHVSMNQRSNASDYR